VHQQAASADHSNDDHEGSLVPEGVSPFMIMQRGRDPHRLTVARDDHED
jgi:hypothetical protein